MPGLKTGSKAIPPASVLRLQNVHSFGVDASGSDATGLATTLEGVRVMQQDQARGTVRRRLSDRIEDAFDQACQQGQAEVAACLLKGLDQCLLGQPTPWERRKVALTLLRTCAERLSVLRHAQASAEATRLPGPFSPHAAIRVGEYSHPAV